MVSVCAILNISDQAKFYHFDIDNSFVDNYSDWAMRRPHHKGVATITKNNRINPIDQVSTFDCFEVFDKRGLREGFCVGCVVVD